ncbi:MAG: SET domain-containing protein-lysine N-methyltransferase [Chitinophagaceae bacterium]
MDFFIHPAIYIAQTERKGLGIFTREALPEGFCVEVSPVLVMDAMARNNIDKTLLHDYIFEWIPDGEKQCCMALGYLSIYNHSPTSNCEYFMLYDEHKMYIQTIRPLVAGEELSINYNGDWNNSAPVWFPLND